ITNKPYIEMYGLSADVVRPGLTLRGLLAHRHTLGKMTRSPEEYRRQLLADIALKKATSFTVEIGGKMVNIVNTPLEGGGWVATHEDVTARSRVEQQQSTMLEQEARRKAVDTAIVTFRERAEAVLKTVNQSAAAMRTTAVSLSSSSSQTSACVE